MDSSCKKCVSVGAEGVRRMPMTRRRRRQRGRAAFVPAPFFRVKECPASKQAVSSDSTSRRPVGQPGSHQRASETQPCETKLGANHWLPACWGQTKTGAQRCRFLLILSREVACGMASHPFQSVVTSIQSRAASRRNPREQRESQHATDSICLQRGPEFREPRLLRRVGPQRRVVVFIPSWMCLGEY